MRSFQLFVLIQWLLYISCVISGSRDLGFNFAQHSKAYEESRAWEEHLIGRIVVVSEMNNFPHAMVIEYLNVM